MINIVKLTKDLHERVVGQDEAVNLVVNAMLRSRFGPLLFVSPHGVGKSELAKAIDKHLFDDDRFMIRLHMHENTKHEDIARLVEDVRKRPYSVVVFDEIEKAHSSVLDTLLVIMNDRYFKDSLGRIVDFSNTVIIMTSNIGTKYLLDGLSGKTSMDDDRLKVIEEVRRNLKPELLMTLNEIVVFDPLSHDKLTKVVRLKLQDVAALVAKKGVAVGYTEAGLNVIVAQIYNPVNGAWSIEKWVKEKVVSKLGMMLFEKEIDENSKVIIHAESNGNSLSYCVEKNRA